MSLLALSFVLFFLFTSPDLYKCVCTLASSSSSPYFVFSILPFYFSLFPSFFIFTLLISFVILCCHPLPPSSLLISFSPFCYDTNLLYHVPFSSASFLPLSLTLLLICLLFLLQSFLSTSTLFIPTLLHILFSFYNLDSYNDSMQIPKALQASCWISQLTTHKEACIN